jgi:hypothetical protein
MRFLSYVFQDRMSTYTCQEGLCGYRTVAQTRIDSAEAYLTFAMRARIRMTMFQHASQSSTIPFTNAMAPLVIDGEARGRRKADCGPWSLLAVWGCWGIIRTSILWQWLVVFSPSSYPYKRSHGTVWLRACSWQRCAVGRGDCLTPGARRETAGDICLAQEVRGS